MKGFMGEIYLHHRGLVETSKLFYVFPANKIKHKKLNRNIVFMPG
jgi:predicted ATP-dependent Lon-type protease